LRRMASSTQFCPVKGEEGKVGGKDIANHVEGNQTMGRKRDNSVNSQKRKGEKKGGRRSESSNKGRNIKGGKYMSLLGVSHGREKGIIPRKRISVRV